MWEILPSIPSLIDRPQCGAQRWPCLITSAGGQVIRQDQALGTGAGVGALSVLTAVGTLVLPRTLVYICVPREGTGKGPCLHPPAGELLLI